jgi:hypothetical protein
LIAIYDFRGIIGGIMDIFKELTLADKPRFDRILQQIQPEISDFSFSNLFMWTKIYGLQAAYLPDYDYWLLLAKPEKWKPFFFAPLGDWSDREKLAIVFNLLRQAAKEEGMQLLLRRVPERMLNILRELDSTLQYREDRNAFDYLYPGRSLAQLSGRKLHSKRNHLNQFLRKYQWVYQPITPEILKECLALEEPWFNLKNNSGEDEAMFRMLSCFFELKVKGAVIRVDDRICGIAVGEQLNRNTAVIHIEKGNTEIDGIYAAVNQQFVVNQWSGMEYINREEDMGMEGLRKVKLSYQPVKLIKKFTVY